MKYIRKAGATSNILQVFVRDSSSTTGAGLTGLVFNTASLTAYFHRDTDTTATAIALVTMTVGTFTSSGFKEIDATNMPGWYQFCPPDAAIAAGAKNCAFHLKGATNMAPLPLEVQLVAYDPDDAVHLGLSALPNAAAGANGGLPLGDASGRVDIGKALGTAVTLDANNALNVSAKYLAGTVLTGRDIGASVLLSAGTGTGQLDFTSGVVKANLVQILATALTETAGQIAGAFKQFFNISSPTGTVNLIPAVTTVTTTATATNLTNAPTAGDFTATMKTSLNAATPSVTVSDKTGFSLSAAGVQAIWDALTSALTAVGSIGKLLVTNIDAAISSRLAPGGTLATVTNLTNAPTAGDFTATMKTSLNAATPSVTVSDKTGFSLTAAYDPAKTAAQAGDAMTLTSGERTTLAGVIWANATRTLTSFGTLVADVATAVWAASVRTLSAFGFTVTTDVSATVTTNLNATVSSRLPTSSYTAPPSAASNADTLLGRNLAGGSNGGRTVQDALRPARNKVTIVTGTLTVYAEDDTTPAWTAAMTTDAAAEPIVQMDPA